MQHDLSLDFVLSFCRDKVPGHGEDSYCYSFCDTAGILGAFDGCGGAGAKKHDVYSGHTEAYMASRFCAGAFYDQFRRLFPCNYSASSLSDEAFGPKTVQRLIDFGPPKNESVLKIKGSSVRTLPSTAAVALLQQNANGDVLLSAIWAGDSRVYVMDSRGLAQLTTDDTSVPDPMENIYEDGILRNVFCTDKPVNLHCKTVRMSEPFVVFSATDGCFGYLSTPMEFEGVILQTLLEADCVAEWEENLVRMIGSVAGDDHTLCMAGYGYNSFSRLQKSFEKRYADLRKGYLLPVQHIPIEDRQGRFALWDSYKDDYMRYIKEEQA